MFGCCHCGVTFKDTQKGSGRNALAGCGGDTGSGWWAAPSLHAGCRARGHTFSSAAAISRQLRSCMSARIGTAFSPCLHSLSRCSAVLRWLGRLQARQLLVTFVVFGPRCYVLDTPRLQQFTEHICRYLLTGLLHACRIRRNSKCPQVWQICKKPGTHGSKSEQAGPASCRYCLCTQRAWQYIRASRACLMPALLM